ncbi:MAG: filamentous hemagglutinin family protein, partial [Polymorphobacter sp.]
SSNVALIAPVGTIDAGDAGVRAGGNVFVAGAQVANADNFSADKGTIGIPGGVTGTDSSAAASANATSAAAAQAADAANPGGANRGDRSRISVEVLGFEGEDDPCAGSADTRPVNCVAPSN